MNFRETLLEYTSVLSPNQWLGISFMLFMLLIVLAILLYQSEGNRRILVNKTTQQDQDLKALREKDAARLDTP